MRSLLRVCGTAGLVLLCAAGPALADDGGFTIKDPRIKESSGLAASRAHPGIYWTHNDSGDGPYVYAVDAKTGQTVARITMAGVGRPRDVEAISIGPDGDLYVGDIGDNLDGSWNHVWIYRFPEPAELRDQTVKATQYDVRYADGPRNAEALMVHPRTGRVYIASKRESGGGLYEGPATLSSSGTNVFHRVGEVPWVTDGAFSPDGTKLALRGYFALAEYAWKGGAGDPLGDWHAVPGTPVQGQSESVTYTPDGSALMVGSEGAESGVVRVPLKEDGAKSGAGGGSSTGSGDGAQKGNFMVGAMVLALATALALGAKRVLRRPRNG
ncbi:WD40 repeat domain-containing protein [Streptomyces sp. NBC_00083]|uniref:WD40 repeat domain-containing protein n=1 Tax=Streptomyces sp. NBC_00083 TaxID=2975647 RepID=UPI00224F0E4A|nr:WD40 repeat domain-containing protein [Streptomyces sp. NBC_00083]MCX5381732.1 WD40 repeat domain-containing protein [Streptomyces sp. NBC_00083]